MKLENTLFNIALTGSEVQVSWLTLSCLAFLFCEGL
jgi:hypothetical protein